MNVCPLGALITRLLFVMLFTGPMKEIPPGLNATGVAVAVGDGVVVTVCDGPVVAVGPTVGVIVGPTVGEVMAVI